MNGVFFMSDGQSQRHKYACQTASFNNYHREYFAKLKKFKTTMKVAEKSSAKKYQVNEFRMPGNKTNTTCFNSKITTDVQTPVSYSSQFLCQPRNSQCTVSVADAD